MKQNNSAFSEPFEAYAKRQTALELLLEKIAHWTKIICASWMALNLLACASAPKPIKVTNPETGKAGQANIISVEEFDAQTKKLEGKPESKLAVVEPKVEVAAAVVQETIPVTPPPDVTTAALTTTPPVTKPTTIVKKKPNALNPQLGDAIDVLVKQITEVKTAENLVAVSQAMPKLAAEVVNKAAPLPIEPKKTEMMLANVPKPEPAMGQVGKLEPVFLNDALLQEESQPPVEKQLATAKTELARTLEQNHVVQATNPVKSGSVFGLIALVGCVALAVLVLSWYGIVAYSAFSFFVMSWLSKRYYCEVNDLSLPLRLCLINQTKALFYLIFEPFLMPGVYLYKKRFEFRQIPMSNRRRSSKQIPLIGHNQIKSVELPGSTVMLPDSAEDEVEGSKRIFSIDNVTAAKLGLALPPDHSFFDVPLLTREDGMVSLDGVVWVNNDDHKIWKHLHCLAAKEILRNRHRFTSLDDPNKSQTALVAAQR